MKKQLLSIIIATIAFQSFSQSKIILPTFIYEDMKAKGQLKQGVEYLQIGNDQPSIPSPVTKEHLEKINEKMAGVNSCSCNVPLDTTFHIAEFTNGTAPEYRNDDGSTTAKQLPFNFCLYGTNYDSVFINNNGNITFDIAYGTYSAVGFPDPAYVMVAPFWADVDTRDPSSGLVYYKITPSYLIVKWKNVGYFNTESDKLNTFQLIITDGIDPILPFGNNIAFCYGDMQWTTGSASQGVNGFGGIAATVGINKGDGTNYVQLGRFDQPGIAYDGGYGNNDGVSWLDNQSLYFNVCSSTNIAPIASGLNNCDTIRVCGSGDTLLLNGIFLAPEINQLTSISINLNGTPNATILSNHSGNSANAIVQIIADLTNAGMNTITFTGTDNGSPVGTTIINAHVFVDTTGISNFNPHISGNLEFCNGSPTTLSVTPTTYDSYVWSTGSFNTSIIVDTSGFYWVTSTLNGCSKSNFVNVIEHSPTPAISGYPFTCGTTHTDLFSDSLIYNSYSWINVTPPNNTNDSVNVGNGTYILTVIDSFGCVASTPPVTVTGALPPVITGATAVCNGVLATLTTTFDYVTYNWTNVSPPNNTNDSVFVPVGTYSVTVLDVNGCTLTSLPVNVTAFSYSLSVTGIQPYCANQSILLTVSSNPSTNANYLWSTGSTNNSINVNTANNYTVALTYPNGCTTNTIVVVPAPNPLPTPVVSGPLFTCGTTPATLSVTPTYPSYTWSNSSHNNSISVLSGSFDVTVTDINGCVGTSPAITIVNANPTVAITGNTPFCPGTNITLTAIPSIPIGANYLWSTQANTQSILVNTSGTFSVAISYSNGCSTSNSATTSLFDGPSANFTQNPPATSPPNNSISFIDNSIINSGTINNWVWNFGDSTNIFHSEQNPTHSYSLDGTYPVTLAVQSNNGCWDTIRIDYTIASDINSPNVFTPGNGGSTGVNQFLYFKNLEFFQGTTLMIYNRWGNKIFESKDYHNDWNGGTHPSGVYYYVLDNPKFNEQKYGFFQMIR